MSLELLSAIFVIGNILVLPVYLLIVFFSQARLTQRFMRSVWSVAAPSLLLIVFGITFVVMDRGVLPRFGELLASAAGSSAFKLYLLLLNDLPPAALVMWLHAIAADLVMARWAYLESQTLKLPTIPVSIALLLMGTNGPLGFVVYLLVRQVWLARHVEVKQ